AIPKAKKFRKDGIAPDFEATLDRMFLETVAIEEDCWAPSSSTVPSSIEDVIESEDIDDNAENLKKKKGLKSRERKGKCLVRVTIASLRTSPLEGQLFETNHLHRICASNRSRARRLRYTTEHSVESPCLGKNATTTVQRCCICPKLHRSSQFSQVLEWFHQ
ncbi:hypothetical protein PIB30_090656, partial [Stylosanthes scabra]|nr:hypothetical protein [Stylosanthes scabra]